MGIYKKIGIRNIALKITEFIQWIRLYGLKDGIKLFGSFLRTSNNYYFVNASFLTHPIKLRNNYSDKAIFFQVYHEKQYELYNIDFEDVKTIIDGGANVGIASVYFANKFKDAEIISIEPEENNFNLLKENTLPYQHIECLQAGIWNKNESIYINNPDALAAGFMVETNRKEGKHLEGITIDEIMKLKNWHQIDILKMDIEGAELEVFSGKDLAWLGKTKLLIIELHDFYKANCTRTFFNAISTMRYDAYFHHENIFIFFK